MTPDFIADLVRRCEGRRIAALDYTLGGARLRLAFRRAGPGPGERAPGAIASPGIGYLCHRHPLGGEPPAQGSAVRRGDIVAFLRLGLLLQPVTAPADGVLGASLCEEGEAVGYGAPLFLLHEG